MNRTYKKGMLLFHKDTKQKIMFGKWNEDKTATCLTQPDRNFVSLTRDQLDTQYTAYSELEKAAREKRRGQGW